MNRTLIIYLGIIMAVMASSVGLVFAPDLQLSYLQPHKDETGDAQPKDYWGAGRRGRRVYMSLGCIYCHSQQVRRTGFGADIDRGWGVRQSVARDYIFDNPHLLGTMRTGPDLLNIGSRQPADLWHHQHHFNPRIVSPGSIMPAFPFLYEKRRLGVGETPPKEAITLPPEWSEPGTYIVPTQDARDLVAYMKMLHHDYPLPEAR